MREMSQLMGALKKVLKAKDLTYREVARALDLSEASVKRIFAEQSLSLRRLEALCRFLDISLYELARIAYAEAGDPVSILALEQEEALAADPRLLSYFYHLLNGWQPARIARKLGLAETESTLLLARLDKLKLIDLYPRNRVRLLTARTIAWRKSGPIRRLYEARVKTEFLDADFERAGGAIKFEVGELSEASVKVLRRKLDRLARDFEELADLDLALPIEAKQSVGLLVACRPWEFSILAGGTPETLRK